MFSSKFLSRRKERWLYEISLLVVSVCHFIFYIYSNKLVRLSHVLKLNFCVYSCSSHYNLGAYINIAHYNLGDLHTHYKRIVFNIIFSACPAGAVLIEGLGCFLHVAQTMNYVYATWYCVAHKGELPVFLTTQEFQTMRDYLRRTSRCLVMNRSCNNMW